MSVDGAPVAFVRDPTAPEWVDASTAPVFVGGGSESWAADVRHGDGAICMSDLVSVLDAEPVDVLSGESLTEDELRERLGIDSEEADA